jgi:hypothetical protein
MNIESDDGITTTKIINFNSKKEDILKYILNIINIKYNTTDEIHGNRFDRDVLLEESNITELMKLQPIIRKSGYKSGKLTSLHKNNQSVQKFPGINMVRQVLKCNGYKLTPIVISLGYDHDTGRKLTKREFQINKIEDI